MKIAAVFVRTILNHRELAIGGILGHAVVDARVIDRDADHWMGRHVVDLLAAEIDRAAVAQRLYVLFGRSESHAVSSLSLVHRKFGRDGGCSTASARSG